MSYRRHADTRPPLPCEGRAEDYTAAFLVVAGLLCFLVLMMLWARWGMPATMICAALAECGLRRF